MKIAVIGDETLAAATALCCARQDHFDVTREVAPDTQIVWICHDTPIGDDDRPDAEFVIARIRELIPSVDCAVLVLVSSQMPVGTTARLEREFPQNHFAYSPENLRVATAVQDFTQQARIVVGVRTEQFNGLLNELFAPFTKQLIFTTPETAEMVKHALNAYLATCIVFINEIARLCVEVGADPGVVSLALRTEARVSPRAPLRPGAPYGGRHLERDIYNLNELANERGIFVPLLANLKASNAAKPAKPDGLVLKSLAAWHAIA